MRRSFPPPVPASAFDSHPTLALLRWRLAAVAALCTLLLAVMAAVLERALDTEAAVRWALGAATLTVLILAFVDRHLSENRRAPEHPVLDALGAGNTLTLYRGLSLAMLGGFFLMPSLSGPVAWIPMGLYTFAAVADIFDGYLARRADHTTSLGARLDLELDGLGVLLAISLAVVGGRLSPAFLLLGAVRYAFVFGSRRRTVRGLGNRELPASAHRRLFAGILMGFASVSLWPIAPREALDLVGAVVAVPVLAGFLRDWLVVIGSLDPASTRYLAAQRSVMRFTRVYMPPVLRATSFVSVACLLLIFPQSQPLAAAVVAGLAAVAVLLGVVGRLASLLLLLPLGALCLAEGLSFLAGIAVASSVAIILVGTGPRSLARPEERFLFRRAGEK